MVGREHTHCIRWKMLTPSKFVVQGSSKDEQVLNANRRHGGGKATAGEARLRLHRAVEGLREGDLASLGPDLMGCCIKSGLEWTRRRPSAEL